MRRTLIRRVGPGMALLELGLLGAMSVQSAVAGPNDLMGILSSDGYGYKR